MSRLSRDYPDITVMARQSPDLPRTGLQRFFGRRSRPGSVLAVRVGIEGIRGMHSLIRCRYDLIIDTRQLHAKIPDTWVIAPPDDHIKHVNIYTAARCFCPWTGGQLPSLCWGTFGDEWAAAPAGSRTLGSLLEYAKQFLNTENHDSAAR